jgi:ligand-binding SRPBCC domain-containing protein
MISLKFESKLSVPRERIWDWITSKQGIATELWPYLRMSVPKGLRSIVDVDVKPGTPLFRSRVWLFGIVPIDRMDLTLIELDRGHGFVEQSPTQSMSLWRHERRILQHPVEPSAVVLVDRLTFCPRRAGSLVGWFLKRVFEHRHAVLRARFGAG